MKRLIPLFLFLLVGAHAFAYEITIPYDEFSIIIDVEREYNEQADYLEDICSSIDWYMDYVTIESALDFILSHFEEDNELRYSYLIVIDYRNRLIMFEPSDYYNERDLDRYDDEWNEESRYREEEWEGDERYREEEWEGDERYREEEWEGDERYREEEWESDERYREEEDSRRYQDERENDDRYYDEESNYSDKR